MKTMRAYEERFARADIVSKVRTAKAEVENGTALLDADEVFARLKAKHAEQLQIKIVAESGTRLR